MNIFVLEDDFLQQQRMERLIRDILSKNKWIPRSMLITSKPSQLLKALKASNGKNIYFLDIEIKGAEKKGMEIAQDVRKLDPYSIIIFVTTHSEFAPLTYKYKVSALEFIDKNSDEETFTTEITECLEMLFSPTKKLVAEEAFVFDNKHSNFQIPFHEILYFETSDISHKIRLIGKTKVIEFYATLEDVEQLDYRFFKCHRSFVINLANVETINRSENIVYFPDEYSCLISRRKTRTAVELIKELNQ